MDITLDGHTALVTGSAKGIGRAFVLALAECGADVAVTFKTSDDAAVETADDARERGAEAVVVNVDVTDPQEVDRLFDRVESRLDAVDIVVNNVGNFAPGHWEEIEWSQWQDVVETNYYGAVLCARRAIPMMREKGWGRIINVGYASSEKGLVSPKNFPYFAAKNSVLMFTRMLAADTQEDGITVNAISPYVVENSDTFPNEAPRGRWARYEDLVAPLLFFCSKNAEYISGENVEVDGGWLPEEV